MTLLIGSVIIIEIHNIAPFHTRPVLLGPSVGVAAVEPDESCLIRHSRNEGDAADAGLRFITDTVYGSVCVEESERLLAVAFRKLCLVRELEGYLIRS